MTECGVSEMTTHCHPELVSGSGFDPVGGRWTVDGQRCLHSVQRFLPSVQRFLDRDAETSSDD